jgi:AcrR family transcriptional regulator
MPRIVTSPRKKPSQDRSRDTVEALMAATTRVLIEVGYDRASTNRVAEVAGVSIGSLYQYFPNKEALVAELIRRLAEKEYQALMEKMAQVIDLPLDEAIAEFIRAVISAHRVEPKLHKVLIEQVPRIGALKQVRELEDRMEEFLRHSLQIRKKAIRTRNIDQAAFILMHTVEAVTHAAVIDEPHHLGDDKLVAELTDLVVRYLVA